jgi:hypothetical protein
MVRLPTCVKKSGASTKCLPLEYLNRTVLRRRQFKTSGTTCEQCLSTLVFLLLFGAKHLNIRILHPKPAPMLRKPWCEEPVGDAIWSSTELFENATFRLCCNC